MPLISFTLSLHRIVDLSGIIFWSALLDRYPGRARAELAEDAAATAWEEGRRTRFERAIELAMDARGR